VDIVGKAMRLVGYLFHLLLALFLLAVAAVTFLSGAHTFKIDLLPWEGQTLALVLLFSALAGIVLIYLALKKGLPMVFLVWSAVVLVMLVRGFFFSSYRFMSGVSWTALILIAGSAIAVAGGWDAISRQGTKVSQRRKVL